MYGLGIAEGVITAVAVAVEGRVEGVGDTMTQREERPPAVVLTAGFDGAEYVGGAWKL